MLTPYDQYIRFFTGRRLYLFGFVFAGLLWLVLTLLHLLVEPHSTTALHMVMDLLALQVSVGLLSTWLGHYIRRHEDEIAHLDHQAEKLAVLQERERFGRELHDGVIQSIYAVGLVLEDCQQRINSEPQLVYARLGQVMTNLNNVIMDIRSYILDLHPAPERQIGISDRLADLVDEMFAESELKPHLETDPLTPDLLSSAQTMEILRIAQEALLNAQRHALATDIVVRLHLADGQVHLQIVDNGVGFTPNAILLSGGLHNMQERAKLLAGQLEIQSVEGQGTCVHLCFAP
ncbi:MAG: sensor histidine kinase [Caldilineaceae bacterium]|nr:sensor histidine kinase [Caldilineaceae bacterium]